MDKLTNSVRKLRIWKDARGQDFIEYALMAGFVAAAGWHHARCSDRDQHDFFKGRVGVDTCGQPGQLSELH